MGTNQGINCTMVHPLTFKNTPHLVFIVTEDWFFVSHFLPMAKVALELGFKVSVMTRVREHRTAIESLGIDVIALEANRKSLNPFAILKTVRMMRERLEDIDSAYPLTLVHCIALRSILLGGWAACQAGIERRIYALTGMGFLGARHDRKARLLRWAIRLVIRRRLESAKTRYLFENPDDPILLGLDVERNPQDKARVVIVGGAGVDPDQLTQQPIPPTPPLRIALVARMLWSKGVDIAVQAVSQARAEGLDVTLSLYGTPDPHNPKSIPESVLNSWGQRSGIHWYGATNNVRAVWAQHHVACLPSRGGEGLPRTLLEAAACGRAIITTDVAGCRHFVRHGIDGYVLPVDDVNAFYETIMTIGRQPDLIVRMGGAARRRIFSGFTEREVMHTLRRLYMMSFSDHTPDISSALPASHNTRSP